MNGIVSRGLWGVLFVGGLSVLGATAATAAETSGDDGIAAGTQAIATIELPIAIGGNAITVLGDSHQADSHQAGSQPAAQPSVAVAPPARTSGADSVLGGTQGIVDVVVPVTVGGNAISVIGDSASSTTAGEADAPASAPAAPPVDDGTSTDGTDSIGGGTQVTPDVTAPLTIGGNAISLIGDTTTTGSSTTTTGSNTGDGTVTSTGATTDGTDSIGGGTQLTPVIGLPIDLTGNAVSVIGDSSTTGTAPGQGTEPGTGTDAGTDPGTGTGTTDGRDSILGGTQVTPDVTAPVTIGGNAISLIGDSTTTGSSTASTGNNTGRGIGTGTGTTTEGTDSIGGGTQLAPVIGLPVDPTGNAVSVIGDSSTTGTAPSQGTDPGTDPGPGTAPGAGVDPAVPGLPLDPGALTPAMPSGMGSGPAALAAADITPVAALAATGTSPAVAGAFGMLLLAAGAIMAALKRMRARTA